MKSLAEIYKNRTTIDITAEGYYWFLDENNMPIGITKEISTIERELIALKYMGIDVGKTVWYSFLLDKNAVNIPDFSAFHHATNFIFFHHAMDLDLQQDFIELVQSFSDDFKVFTLEQNYGVILNLSSDPRILIETEDFLLAAVTDFAAVLTFYQTVSYELNRRLPEKFIAEFDLFKKFGGERKPLLRHKDIFINYLMSSEIVSAHPIFGDWFSPFLTLDKELLAVVKCYLENDFNVTTGAKIMHMHRNTFMNKLNRFIEITGLDVKNFDEATIAYLLMQLRRDV